jgi:hypothetical protein
MPTDAETLRVIRSGAAGIIEGSTRNPRSPGPVAVLTALVEGPVEAALAALGHQATYETLQPIADRIAGAAADMRIAKLKKGQLT